MTIEFRGKKYRSVATFAKAYNMTTADAQAYIDKHKTRLLVNLNGDVQKVDLRTVTVPDLTRHFNIKRAAAQKLIKGGIIKGIDIFDELNDFVEVNLNVFVELNIRISTYTVTRTPQLKITCTNRTRLAALNEAIDAYINTYDHQAELLSGVVKQYTSALTGDPLELINGKLREYKPICIRSLYNEIIDSKNWVNNCVRDYIKSVHCLKGRVSNSTIDNIGDSEGVSGTELLEYCQNYNVKLILYELLGEVVASHYPVKKIKRKPIIGIAYNNHFYPIKSKKLNRVVPIVNKVKYIKNVDQKLVKCLESGILPTNLIKSHCDVSGSFSLVRSFVHKNIQYVDNPDFSICQMILSRFGLSDKIQPLTTVAKLGGIIEQLYVKQSVESFFPECDKFVKGGYNYVTTRKFNPDDTTTIDKNKSYSHALHSLEYIIVCDYRTAKITFNPKVIIDHYLYIAKPKQSTILLPNTNIYAGYHLKKAYKNGIKFKLLEEITTSRVPNYYKDMVDDIYNKLDDIMNKDNKPISKDICNMWIGKMSQFFGSRMTNYISKICNEDEAKRSKGSSFPLFDSGYYIVEDSKIVHPSIYTKKIISIQILDKSREVLFDKMQSLGLKNDDIVQVKTDAITFLGKKHIEYGTGLHTWKKEKFKPIKMTSIVDLPVNSFVISNAASHNKNILYDCYAGSGKTYRYLNEIIPKLQNENVSYKVLTPSHASLIEYRNAGFNCDVIQVYTCNNKVPHEDYIIIDEIGMCDKLANDLIYKCHQAGKTLNCAGDYKQLEPVCKRYYNEISKYTIEYEDGSYKEVDMSNIDNRQIYNNPYYINHIYGTIEHVNTNHRNNFTIEYYDQIINKQIDIETEVLRHSIDYKIADTIICYRRKTVAKYNNLKMKALGYESKHQFNDTNNTEKFEVKGNVKGMRIKCNSNKLRNKKIFNNFIFTIKKQLEDNELLLSDDNVITLHDLQRYFIPAYAMTAYGVQGSSLSSYHFPPEDSHFLSKSEFACNLAYVIISRLKT